MLTRLPLGPNRLLSSFPTTWQLSTCRWPWHCAPPLSPPLLKTLTPSPHGTEEVAFIVPFREGSERIAGTLWAQTGACKVPQSSSQTLGRRRGVLNTLLPAASAYSMSFSAQGRPPPGYRRSLGLWDRLPETGLCTPQTRALCQAFTRASPILATPPPGAGTTLRRMKGPRLTG